MISNLGTLIKQLKPKLEVYLNSQGIKTQGRLFKCPNFKQHNNLDAKPSCNFYPDKENFKCFACRATGDIFDAVHYLEGKDIKGDNFLEVVKYLCKKFDIKYEETLSYEEEFFRNTSLFLENLVNIAHNNLKNIIKNNQRQDIIKFLENKQWINSVDKFKLGIFTSVPNIKTDPDILTYLRLGNGNISDKIVNRIIIPLYNIKNEICGITCRIINETIDNNKYLHYVSYPISNILYNLNNINTQDIIIVEGASSVLTMYNYNINNVVATLGNNLHEKQIELLVKKQIKNITLCYDNDFGGINGIRNALLSLSKHKNDFEQIDILLVEEGLDPGEHVIKNKSLDVNVNKISLLDYIFNKYKENNSDKLYEKCLAFYLHNITDLALKEKTIKLISKKLEINKSTLEEIIDSYTSDLHGSISDIVAEKESIIQVINDFERWAWSRGELLGLSSFKQFDSKLDGIQQGLTLVAGKPNCGKSAMLISLALQLMKNNDNVYILYFSIDDPLYTTIARFISNLSELPINIVSNPTYKIIKADLSNDLKKEYIKKREEAINFLRNNTSIFSLKGSDYSTIETLIEKIYTYKDIAQDKQIVIFIDNLHNLKSTKRNTDRHLYSCISNELSNLANEFKSPIIASTHITKESIKNKNFEGTAIKETVDLFFDAKLIVMIDFPDDPEMESLRDDVLLDVYISKNKMSGFKGKLNFMFYRSLSKVIEVDNSENIFEIK